MKKSRLPLSIWFVALVAAAWKWSLVLEARLSRRLEQGQPLRLQIVRGSGGITQITPPSTDAFILSISGLSGYRSGYTNEQWRIEQLKFRSSTAQGWKLLPESSWRSNWCLVTQLKALYPRQGKHRDVVSVWRSNRERELLPGQYQMRARFNCEFHDNRSGIRYLGAGIFRVDFHVNPAPQRKKRVILDAARQVG